MKEHKLENTFLFKNFEKIARVIPDLSKFREIMSSRTLVEHDITQYSQVDLTNSFHRDQVQACLDLHADIPSKIDISDKKVVLDFLSQAVFQLEGRVSAFDMLRMEIETFDMVPLLTTEGAEVKRREYYSLLKRYQLINFEYENLSKFSSAVEGLILAERYIIDDITDDERHKAWTSVSGFEESDLYKSFVKKSEELKHELKVANATLAEQDAMVEEEKAEEKMEVESAPEVIQEDVLTLERALKYVKDGEKPNSVPLSVQKFTSYVNAVQAKYETLKGMSKTPEYNTLKECVEFIRPKKIVFGEDFDKLVSQYKQSRDFIKKVFDLSPT